MTDVMGSVGNILHIYPAILAIAISVVVIAYGIYVEKFLDVAPTVSWVLLMQAPFVLQSGFYNPESALTQSCGIFIMSFAIVIGDSYSLRRKSKIQCCAKISNYHGLLIICIIGLIFFPFYHLSQIENIPFLDRLWGNFTANEIAQRRELFSKGLNVNIFFKYASQWVCTVFGPLAFTLLVIKKNYFSALVVCLWVVIYSVLSTARMPILLFITLSILGISYLIPARLRKIIGGIVLIFWTSFLFLSIQRVGEIKSWYIENKTLNTALINYSASEAAQDPLRQLTLNDIERVDGVNILGEHGAITNFLIYRIFLSPVDVSNHWYTFYGQVAREKRTAWDLIRPIKSGDLRASNMVGRWAYFERFPSKYLSTISAYGSIDADAYSFGGLFSVLLVGLSYLLLRIYSVWLKSHSVGSFMSPIMTGYFAIFLIQSSLQAILVAQGLLILMAISIYYFWQECHRATTCK